MAFQSQAGSRSIITSAIRMHRRREMRRSWIGSAGKAPPTLECSSRTRSAQYGRPTFSSIVECVCCKTETTALLRDLPKIPAGGSHSSHELRKNANPRRLKSGSGFTGYGKSSTDTLGCAIFAIDRVPDARKVREPHSQEWLCY